MARHTKFLWIVTAGNVALAVVLLIALYSVMLALAVLAPEISGWPVVLIVAVGVVLSVLGLYLTRDVASRWSRVVPRVLNASALLLDLLVIAAVCAIFVRSVREYFVMPYGYKGDVYIVYGKRDCAPLAKTRNRITYDVPNNGILTVCGTMDRTWTETEYFYRTPNGKLDKIRNFWPTTIHPTPENVANNSDFGVFFPRTGSLHDSSGCTVEFQQFYVGTKHHLLTEYKPIDLDGFLHQHPVGCADR